MKTSLMVNEIVADELSVDTIIVTPRERFVEDLGADSLDAVELVMRIEEEFDLEITDDEAQKLVTVGELVRYVEAKVGVNFEPKGKRKISTEKTTPKPVSPDKKITKIEKRLEDIGEFLLTNDEDSRERILASIVRRRGQSKFRNSLLGIYNKRCAITGNRAVEALEAAHISPFRGEDTNHVTNGLLLRADIHTLFDLHLICVDTETMTVLLSPQLKNTGYHHLAGKPLRVSESRLFHPSKEALDEHRKKAGF